MKKNIQQQSRNKFLHGLKVFGYLLVASLIFLIPSIWNGYPLVFSDTGSYIYSAFSLKVPLDRPIGYGYFIRLFSLGASLWFVVYAQAFFTVYLVWKTLRVFVSKRPFLTHFCLTVLLACLTTASWIASQVMPDAFPALMLLIVFVFITGKNSVAERIFLALLLMFFLVTHNANFLLLLGVLFLSFLMVFFFRRFSKHRSEYLSRMGMLAVTALFAPVFFLVSNNAQGYGTVLSPSSDVFMMSRVNDAGILDDFLSSHCSQVHYYLCLYAGNFPQGDAFIWNNDSPVNIRGWQESRDEFDMILRQVFANPSYVADFVGDSFYRSVKLLFMFGMDSYYPYDASGPIYPQIMNFFPQELPQYVRARQYRGDLQTVHGFDLLFMLTGFAGFLYLLWNLFGSRLLDEKGRFFVLQIFSLLLVNASVMATFSGVYGRYQERLAWLLPFAGALFLLKRIFSQEKILRK